jgi:hypothetical protein
MKLFYRHIFFAVAITLATGINFCRAGGGNPSSAAQNPALEKLPTGVVSQVKLPAATPVFGHKPNAAAVINGTAAMNPKKSVVALGGASVKLKP